MNKREVRAFIIGRLENKLNVFGLSARELGDDFDLVASGLLDSMAFVDLVAGTEDHYGIEIDFEDAAATPDFTSLGGLIDIIIRTKDA